LDILGISCVVVGSRRRPVEKSLPGWGCGGKVAVELLKNNPSYQKGEQKGKEGEKREEEGERKKERRDKGEEGNRKKGGWGGEK
jgi:hypothetical protein